MFLLEATNPGERSVKLNTMGFQLGGGKTVALPKPQSNVNFPHRLEEGESCTVWVEIKEVANALQRDGFKGTVTLRGFYRDQLGTEYLSSAYEFNPDDWTS